MKRSLQQINALNTELVSVKMQLQYIEKYKHAAAFVCLADMDKAKLIKYLAPIVYMDDTDEYAKRFDNSMYGMMIAQIEGCRNSREAKKQLIEVLYQSIQSVLQFRRLKQSWS